MLPDLKTTGTTAGKALVNWWRAVSIEAFCCAILWLVGLLLIRVPLAPLWALIAGLMTFVPNFGPVIGLLGPVFAILLSGRDMERLLYLLGLYAVIVVIDQLLLPPLLAIAYAFRKPPEAKTNVFPPGDAGSNTEI